MSRLLEGDVDGPQHARDLADGCGQLAHLALRQPPRAVAPQAQPRDERQEAPAPARTLRLGFARASPGMNGRKHQRLRARASPCLRTPGKPMLTLNDLIT